MNTLTPQAVVSQFLKLAMMAPAPSQSPTFRQDSIRKKLQQEAAQHGIKLLDPRYSIWDQVT